MKPGPTASPFNNFKVTRFFKIIPIAVRLYANVRGKRKLRKIITIRTFDIEDIGHQTSLRVTLISIDDFSDERMADDIAGEEFYLLNAFNALENTQRMGEA